MELTRLNELLIYNAATGEVSTRASNRRVEPDADGVVVIWDSLNKRKVKFKMNRLCWTLGNNKKLRKNQRVLHKNLNTDDNRLINISAVSLAVFAKINEAARNLRGELKITPHVSDKWDWLVIYFENKIKRSERFSDIVFAQRRLLVLQLKFAKVLTRWCIFEK
jgi:hypothetical protein